MNTLKLTLSTLLVTSPVFVHGEYPMRDFARAHPSPSLGSITDFLHEHRHNESLCNSISYSIKIQRKPSTSNFEWFKIIGILAKLMDKAQKASEGDMRWAAILGTPIKESIEASGNDTGIHGTMNITLERNQFDTISIKVRLYHDEDYDTLAWQSIIKTIEAWVKQCKKHDFKFFKFSPLCSIVRCNHAHQDTSIKFKDEEKNKIILGYSGK